VRKVKIRLGNAAGTAPFSHFSPCEGMEIIYPKVVLKKIGPTRLLESVCYERRSRWASKEDGLVARWKTLNTTPTFHKSMRLLACEQWVARYTDLITL
jgi:hypothetical protein